MAQPKGLGRGLGALLGDFQEPVLEKSNYRTVPLHRIEPNPDQPRKDFDEEALQELSESISVHGLIQPLTVRETEPGYYQIIAGERRWRASRMAGLGEVPVVVIEADDCKAMELALIENLQCSDLNCVEEALGYQALVEDFGLTQEDCASRVGKSRSAVANAMRLLNLPEKVLGMLREGSLTAGHARAVLSLPAGEVRLQLLRRAAREAWSVAKTEQKVKEAAAPAARPKRRIMVRDVRIFVNSVNRAVDVMRSTGINASYDKQDSETELILTVRIPKKA